jgi:hypothetical protein
MYKQNQRECRQGVQAATPLASTTETAPEAPKDTILPGQRKIQTHFLFEQRSSWFPRQSLQR